MTLLPTALEEAAKALVSALHLKTAIGASEITVATAAITAYLAQAEKEGLVMVPKIILDAQATSTTPTLAAAQNGGE